MSFTETLTHLEKWSEFAGAVTWIIVGFFVVRAILPYLLPYVTVLEGEAMVVERWKRYNRTITKGTHLLIPLLESVKTVSWSFDDRYEGPVIVETSRIMTRKTKLELMPFKALTKDSQRVGVTIKIMFFISDVKHVVYHGNNLYGKIQKLIQSRVKESVQQFLVENLTMEKLQENVEIFLEGESKIFEKHGVSGVACEILDIKYPTALTEKRELLEEIEIQQDLQEKLYKQRSIMMLRELSDIIQFARENQLDSVVLGQMLASVISVNHSSQ